MFLKSRSHHHPRTLLNNSCLVQELFLQLVSCQVKLGDPEQITSTPVQSLVRCAFWLLKRLLGRDCITTCEVLFEYPDLISHWGKASEPGAELWRIRPSSRRSITITLERMLDTPSSSGSFYCTFMLSSILLDTWKESNTEQATSIYTLCSIKMSSL